MELLSAKEKYPEAPGIDLGTFRLLAQSLTTTLPQALLFKLNHCRLQIQVEKTLK
jgi:hypothetical protein